MIDMKKKYPVLRGFISPDGKTIKVWCAFCNAFHVHGWTPGEGRDRHKGGHRVAHCREETPLKGTGYKIEAFRPGDLEGGSSARPRGDPLRRAYKAPNLCQLNSWSI